MTREEAMYWLDNIRSVAESIDMAIETLQADKDELSATNTEKSSNCGDLISRADAVKAIESRYTEQWIDADVDYNNGLESAVAEIKALPSADRPTGRWVRSGNTLICPICGAKGEDIKDDYCFNYCPNCGAKMDGERSE